MSEKLNSPLNHWSNHLVLNFKFIFKLLLQIEIIKTLISN